MQFKRTLWPNQTRVPYNLGSTAANADRTATQKLSNKLNYTKIVAFPTVHTSILNYQFTCLTEKTAKKNKN